MATPEHQTTSSKSSSSASRFDINEFLALTRKLEKHYSIFSRLWALGVPVMTDEVPTACVGFDRIGNVVTFEINPTFWSGLTEDQKAFTVSHECLHAVLHHGLRSSSVKDEDQGIANVAMDLVVNHLLVDRFGFKREDVDPEDKLCWVDTVFGKEEDAPDAGESFEFYFNALNGKSCAKLKAQLAAGASGVPSLADDHSNLPSFDDGSFEETVADAAVGSEASKLKDIIKEHTGDIQDECTQRGFSPGSGCVTIKLGRVSYKRKWETVIKRWALKAAADTEAEQWVKRARRLTFLKGDLLIPSTVETEDFERERISVWFFQDTSGSCSHLVDRFFKAAMTLPPDRFDVRMHCFDTRVFKTSLKTKKLYGFGGTSFSCIEQFIQCETAERAIGYPQAVWVITDGYGDNVFPEYPERWSWFLSTNERYYIPHTSKVFQLSDFE